MPTSPRPQIHGHRGCRGLYPENTLPAFLHALALGVDVVEMDVVISADKQVVVSHEPWFNPLICLDPAGRAIPPGSARHHNLYGLDYAQIRQYDCGSLCHPGFPGQAVQPCYKPLLREVLLALETATMQLGRPAVGYSIEIKCSPGGDGIFHPGPHEFLSLVLAELLVAEVVPRSTLLCFDARILRLAHQQIPGLATCLLLEDHRPWATHLHELGFVPTVLGPDFTTATPSAIESLRQDFPNLQLVPWTVNQIPAMASLMALGVDGMTTDYPNRALSLLDNSAV